MKSEKINYVNEADLKEDVRTLYETGEFPERLARNLQEMVNRICGSRRFNGYTEDWKEDMRSNALQALVKTLNERKYDLDRKDTKFFSWASRVIFNQFYMSLAKRKRQVKHDAEIKAQIIVNGNTYTKEAMP